MTSRSRTHRHRSTPQIAPRTNFFPTLPSSSSHVQRAHDPPFPFTCSTPPQPFEKLPPLLSSPLLSSPPHSGRSRRGRDSKLRICFSTSLFTFSRRRAQDEWGRKARRVNRRRRLAFLTLTSPFLPFSSPFSFLFSFSSSPLVSHSIRMRAFLFRSKPNDEWLLE